MIVPEENATGRIVDIFVDKEWWEQQAISMWTTTSGTSEHPVVAVDMKQVEFPDALPWIDPVTNRTMLPIRYVAEAVGADVVWSDASGTATIRRSATTIVLRLNDGIALVNDKPMALDAPLKLVPPGRILAPLRFVSESLGLRVDWIGDHPPPSNRTWLGRYQVWLWDLDGYWGPYDFADRMALGWWLLRQKEVDDFFRFCAGEEIDDDPSYTHWLPDERLLPYCAQIMARFDR